MLHRDILQQISTEMSHHTRYSRPFICHILSFSYIITNYLQQPQPMMNACCYLLRRHFFKKISSIHSHSKQHERHDWDTVSSAEKKLAAILQACRHTSESKSTIAANNCISNIEADWETLGDHETSMKRQAWRVLLTLNGEKEPTSLT